MSRKNRNRPTLNVSDDIEVTPALPIMDVETTPADDAAIDAMADEFEAMADEPVAEVIPAIEPVIEPVIEDMPAIVTPEPVIEAAPVVAPIGIIARLVALASTLAVRTVRAVSEGAIVPSASALLTMLRSVKTTSAGWHFMHAMDGQYSEKAPAAGHRWHVRIVILDSIAPDAINRRHVCQGYAMVGAYLNPDGTIDYGRGFRCNPNAMARVTIRDVANAELGSTDTMSPGSAKQCADTRNANVTIDVGPNGSGLSITGNANRGGTYALSAVFLADGTRIG